MNLRKYQPKDRTEIRKMLLDEKTPGRLGYNDPDYETYVLTDRRGIIGFFTFKSGHIPLLQHFCIKKDRRGLSPHAFILVSYLKKIFKSKGIDKIIIECPESKEIIQRFIEKCFEIIKSENRWFRYENNIHELKKLYLVRV